MSAILSMCAFNSPRQCETQRHGAAFTSLWFVAGLVIYLLPQSIN